MKMMKVLKSLLRKKQSQKSLSLVNFSENKRYIPVKTPQRLNQISAHTHENTNSKFSNKELNNTYSSSSKRPITKTSTSSQTWTTTTGSSQSKILKYNNSLIKLQSHLANPIEQMNQDEKFLITNKSIFNFENYLRNFTNFEKNFLQAKIKSTYINLHHNISPNSKLKVEDIDLDIQKILTQKVFFIEEIKKKLDNHYQNIIKSHRKIIDKDELFRLLNHYLGEIRTFNKSNNNPTIPTVLYSEVISFLDNFIQYLIIEKIHEKKEDEYLIIMNKFSDVIRIFDLLNYDHLSKHHLISLVYTVHYLKSFFKITESSYALITHFNKSIETNAINKKASAEDQLHYKEMSSLLTYLLLTEEDDIRCLKYIYRCRNSIFYEKDINEIMFIFNYVLSKSVTYKQKIINNYEKDPSKFHIENFFNSYIAQFQNLSLSPIDSSLFEMFSMIVLYVKQSEDFFKGLMFNKDSTKVLGILYSGNSFWFISI